MRVILPNLKSRKGPSKADNRSLRVGRFYVVTCFMRRRVKSYVVSDLIRRRSEEVAKS